METNALISNREPPDNMQHLRQESRIFNQYQLFKTLTKKQKQTNKKKHITQSDNVHTGVSSHSVKCVWLGKLTNPTNLSLDGGQTMW